MRDLRSRIEARVFTATRFAQIAGNYIVNKLRTIRRKQLIILLTVISAYGFLLGTNVLIGFPYAASGGNPLAVAVGTFVLALSLALNWLFLRRIYDLRREATWRAEAEGKLALTLNNMRDGIVAFDADQRLVVANRRYQEIYDLPDALVQPGTPFAHIIDSIRQHQPGMPPTSQFIRDFLVRLNKNDLSPILITTRELVVAVSYRARPGGGWVSTHEDVTERSRLEKRLNHLALHDPLTGLANRVVLAEQLERALGEVKAGRDVAVLFLDLDRFKPVNDTLGHPVGDALLKQVAQRLRDCTQESDVVARMGGDEFAILQLGPQPASASALASRIIKTLTEPYEINEHHVVVGTSVGIAITPVDGLEPDQLLKRADLALYLAKSDGRGVYRFFDSEGNRRVYDRQQLERDMRKALGERQFELHYQPILDLQTSEIRGMEALIRWDHPEKGRISPADFIPLAEETGLIAPIGEWVLRQACADAAGWPEEIGVAVNVSPVQLRKRNLLQAVFSAVSASGLSPHRLEIEITETTLLQDSEVTLATLHQLRNLGVGIVLDDFGTGYSSLSYFRSFPFDKIKIDRSFIENVTEGGSSLAIIRAVASLAASLKVTTTAEGIETEAQLVRVRNEGITQAQGFLIGRPRPARDVREMLSSERAKRSAG